MVAVRTPVCFQGRSAKVHACINLYSSNPTWKGAVFLFFLTAICDIFWQIFSFITLIWHLYEMYILQ